MEREKKVFAKGYNIYKLLWIFLLWAFLGDVLETVFCRFSLGAWMSRSSLIYAPMSIVWGIGAVVLTVLLHRLENRNDRYIFVCGAILGGVYEYCCSLFTEYVLGSTFWDYSHMPFNINGRINLLFCLFWGILALIWIKELYPRTSWLIEKIPCKVGKPLTIILVTAVVADIVLSAGALIRFERRSEGITPRNQVEEFIDSYYGNEKIYQVYPKLKLAEMQEKQAPSDTITKG